MVPTLKIFGVVSRFLYSGGWQVWWRLLANTFKQSAIHHIRPVVSEPHCTHIKIDIKTVIKCGKDHNNIDKNHKKPTVKTIFTILNRDGNYVYVKIIQ